jgi:glyoxylase-like metal-dependent hydrolase (beta-lactamase superfamily II)
MNMAKLALCWVGVALLGLACGDDKDKETETGVEPIQPGQTPLQKLAIGLGGQDQLDALTGLEIKGSGTRHIPHEGQHPTDPPAEANKFDRTVSIDLPADSLRVDTNRTVEILFPGMSSYTDVVRGNLGGSSEPFFGSPLGALSSDKAAAIKRQETLLTPQLLWKSLTPANLTTQPDVMVDGVNHHRLVDSSGPAPLTLFVNAESGQLSKLETEEHDFYLRDVPLEIDFSDWAPAGDLSFPRKLKVVRDGLTLFEESVSSVTVNPTFDATEFDFPGGVTPSYDAALYARGVLSHQWYYLLDSLGLPFTGVDTAITPRELATGTVAPGVVQLLGGSHHSFLVEQQNGIVLVDAPLHQDRGHALSDYIASHFPGKPITHIVASHFHEDHVSGIRQVLGENPSAQLVVHESSLATWREILGKPSKLHPDALADAPREVSIVTVPDAGQLTLPDPVHPLTLYPLASEHAADLLFAHEQSTNTVFVVDVYSPGNPTQLNADDFAASLATHAIPTETLQIVGGHGGEIHNFAQLQANLP